MANVSSSDLRKYIKSILKDADLTKISSKMIRRQCEEEFKTEFTSRKQEIDKMIMSCIDENGESKENESGEDQQQSDAADPESATSESEDESAEDTPPVKKKKQSRENHSTSQTAEKPKPKSKEPVKSNSSSNSDNDADVARKLQEEEWNFRSRAAKRTTTRRTNASSKKSKKSGEPRIRKGTSAYSRKCALSSELAAIMNEAEMARSDVVKKMWSIVRERNLFDPKNKQFAICDDELQSVFGKKRVRMFGMMKYLKNHIKDVQ